MKVYGPYKRKDGRMHVVLYKNRRRQTVSYPKYLMEKHLGRKLLPNETVDHVDGDIDNNEITNLQVLDRSEHASKDHIRAKPLELVCIWCGRLFERMSSQTRHNSKTGKAGPFCDRVCAGKYGREVQLGKIKRLPIQPRPKLQYY